MLEPHDFQSAFDPACELDEFRHDRAYWLGRCAALVYPVTEEEVQADRKAREARAVERALNPPWWKPWLKNGDTVACERARAEARAAVSRIVSTEALRIDGEIRAWGFDRFQFMSGHSTQCFVAASDTLIVVCFRGTEANRFWDLYADLMAIPMRSDTVPGDLHLGFWTALDQVWGDTAPPLVWPTDENGGRCDRLPDCLRAFTNEQHPQPVWITGHSLGGALATMAAARLIGEGVLRPEQVVGGVYTFGQPRVGDKVFAEAYEQANALGARHFRVVHDNDVVTRLPPDITRVKASWWFVRSFVEDYPDQREDATGGSRFQYRHVGRVAFLSWTAVIEPNLAEWELLPLQMTARLKALFKKGPLRERLFPGLSDHSMSNYSTVLAASRVPYGESSSTITVAASPGELTTPRHEVTDGQTTNVVAMCGGSALGLMAGLLMGLSGSPTVSMANAGLAAWLSLTLWLDDRHFTHARAMAIGTCGFVWVPGVLLGTCIRIH